MWTHVKILLKNMHFHTWWHTYIIVAWYRCNKWKKEKIVEQYHYMDVTSCGWRKTIQQVLSALVRLLSYSFFCSSINYEFMQNTAIRKVSEHVYLQQFRYHLKENLNSVFKLSKKRMRKTTLSVWWLQFPYKLCIQII